MCINRVRIRIRVCEGQSYDQDQGKDQDQGQGRIQGLQVVFHHSSLLLFIIIKFIVNCSLFIVYYYQGRLGSAVLTHSPVMHMIVGSIPRRRSVIELRLCQIKRPGKHMNSFMCVVLGKPLVPAYLHGKDFCRLYLCSPHSL